MVGRYQPDHTTPRFKTVSVGLGGAHFPDGLKEPLELRLFIGWSGFAGWHDCHNPSSGNSRCNMAISPMHSIP
jgi:hypothetical protein